MRYKDDEATVEYDEDAEIFHGEVADLRDLITFQGKSVTALKKAFADSIEDYLSLLQDTRRGGGEAVLGPIRGAYRSIPAQGCLHRRTTRGREPEQVRHVGA